jgi:pimeloyl-ACP methyl ester carboxylesterase
MLPVEVTAQSAIYDVMRVDNNIEAMAFAVSRDTWSHEFQVLKNQTISGTYDISVQLCVPPEGSKKDHLQVVTHGYAFDKRYWDSEINPAEYSYVESAMNAGYSVLTYDRLGTGKSPKPDAYTGLSATVELEMLREISQMARNGDLMKHVSSGDIDTEQSFNKIIHVGHSFGSILTWALLTTYPQVSDGAVLTSYILNTYVSMLRLASFGVEFAPTTDPALFSDFSSGYFVQNSAAALQSGFFSTFTNKTTGIGGFEPELLDYAFSIRQPTGVSDWTTPALLNIGAAPGFTGPVQFMIAEFDYVVCLGDCRGVYDPATIRELFSNALDVNFYIQEGSGHGLTMHKGANVGYKVSLDWLDSNGL